MPTKRKPLLSPKDAGDRVRLMESSQPVTGLDLARAELRLEALTIRSIKEFESKLMKAIESLNSNITALTTAVDAAVAAGIGLPASPSGVPEADVQAASDAVAAQTARIVAATPVPTPPQAS